MSAFQLFTQEALAKEGAFEIYVHIGAGMFLFSAALLTTIAIRLSFGRRQQGWFALRMAILLLGLVGLGEAFEYFVSPQIHEFFHYIHLLSGPVSLFFLYIAIVELRAFYFDHKNLHLLDNRILFLIALSTIALAAALGYQAESHRDMTLELPFLTVTLIPTLVMAFLLLRTSLQVFGEQKEMPLMNLSVFSTTLSIVPLLAWGAVTLSLTLWLGRVAEYLHMGTAYDVFHSLENITIGGLSFALVGAGLMLILSKDVRWIEDRLINAGKMISLGELASSLASDLNNPLMSIIGYSTIMLEDQKIPAARRQDLQMIQQEASRAAKVTKEMQDYAGEDELKFQVANVETLLDQALNLLDSRIRQARIEVVKSVQRPLPLISADVSQIKQAFVNTVHNAIDAMARGGRLEIFVVKDKKNVEITFSDSGEGISGEVLDRIFEPFFTMRSQGGTGLGLSLAKSIIQKHRGSIEVSSQVGLGTSFIIKLPALPEEETFWHPERESGLDYL